MNGLERTTYARAGSGCQCTFTNTLACHARALASHILTWHLTPISVQTLLRKRPLAGSLARSLNLVYALRFSSASPTGFTGGTRVRRQRAHADADLNAETERSWQLGRARAAQSQNRDRARNARLVVSSLPNHRGGFCRCRRCRRHRSRRVRRFRVHVCCVCCCCCRALCLVSSMLWHVFERVRCLRVRVCECVWDACVSP